MKFKVGDKVKWNGSKEEFTVSMTFYTENVLKSKKEHVISYVNDTDNTCVFMNCKPYWFNLEWLEKVESEPKIELIKGKRYEVSNNEDFSDSLERIFESYDEGFLKPYRCIDRLFEDDYENKFGILTDSWKYIREIQLKYKPHTEPKLEWLKEGCTLSKHDSGRLCRITGILRDNKITIRALNGGVEVVKTLEEAFCEFDYAYTCRPFGEEIK